MPLKARVWSLGKLLLLAAALAGTFLLFALVSMRVALRARDVEVPNLVGATVANASLTVADLAWRCASIRTSGPTTRCRREPSCSRSRRPARPRAASDRFACG